MKRALRLLLSAVVIILQGIAVAATKETPDVLYGPTPQRVVDAMLEEAALRKGDVLADLGSGDGRIVIRAALRYGVRGIGIEIDPGWIKKGRRNAREAGVDGQVTFVQGDFFTTDLSSATVVTMFLNPPTMLKIRSRLLALKPGTRLISHKYDMGDWRPDAVRREGRRVIYRWTVPGRAAGAWRCDSSTKLLGRESGALIVAQNYQEVGGTLEGRGEAPALRGGRLSGERISFVVRRTVNGRIVPLLYKGIVDGDRITGSIEYRGGAGTWSARRYAK